MKNYHKILLMTTITAAQVMSASAQDKEQPFSLSVNAGIEFDSNITVDAIDSNSDVGDTAFVFDGSASYDFIDNDEMSFSGGYNYYQSLHNDLEQFDMSIHGFNLDGRYTIDRTDLGLTYAFNTIGLGGNSFMDMHTIRPNVGYLLNSNNVYLIAAYEYQKQTFKQAFLQGRNAKRNSGSIKSIFILGEGRTATASYEFTDHNTSDPGYTYSGHTLDFSLKLPLDIMDRETTVRTGYRYQNRNYNTRSRIYNAGIARDDKRHTFNASIEVPIVNGFVGKAEYEYISSNSNYAPIDYNESITTFSVGWEF